VKIKEEREAQEEVSAAREEVERAEEAFNQASERLQTAEARLNALRHSTAWENRDSRRPVLPQQLVWAVKFSEGILVGGKVFFLKKNMFFFHTVFETLLFF
jgi:hypothetical protein